jgi:subtilisin family serine protease
MRRLLVGLALLVTATIPVAATSVSASHSFTDGAYIITLRDGVSPADVIDDFSIAPTKSTVLDEDDPYFFAVLTGDVAAELSRDTRIADIREEMFARSMEVQTSGPVFNGTQLPIPWGIDRTDSRTGLDGKFTYSSTGAGVRVYVVDSGVNASHPAFGNPSRVVDGWSYRAYEDPLNSYKNAAGSDSCPYDLTFNQLDPAIFDKPTTVDVSDTGKVDNDGHGTHVAGSVAGALTGVAQGATIVPVRVLDSCGQGTETMITRGLKWIHDQHKPGETFANSPAVVNMSLGFGDVSELTEIEIQKILGLGIPVIAAAGNATPTVPARSACGTTPAGTPGTFSIGAMTSLNAEASYSYYGSCVDMFAPGSTVLSTWPYYKPSSATAQVNTYASISGTSMAAPHVAGAVARFLQGKTLSPSLPTQAWEWIKFNATCDAVTPFSTARTEQTPNRLLAVEAPAIAPCAPKTVTSVARDRSVDVSWGESLSPHSAAITSYTATASPGGQKCETLTLTCTITGLTNNTSYAISVSVTNSAGTRASASTSTAQPEGIPNAVTDLTLTAKLSELDVAWKQGAGDGTGITYTATATPSGKTCESTSTSCAITGLTNGTQYTVSVVGTNPSGSSTAVTATGTPNGVAQPVVRIWAEVSSAVPTVDWLKPAVDGVDITYVAVAEPGGITCTTTTTSCAFDNLVNGVMYTVTISGKNSMGESVIGSTMVRPDGPPALPARMKTTTSNSAMKFSWPAVTNTLGVTYILTASPGGRKCTTKRTSCTIKKLKNGKNYSFSMTTKSPTAKVSTSKLVVRARPGFTVKKTTVALRSRTKLGSILTTISKGRKTWTETGTCRIVSGRLVAPRKKTRCVVTLRVARTAKHPAMSTRLAIVVK